MSGSTRTYEGSSYFRQRLVFATLSRTTIKIKQIRTKDDNPGLREYEASFLRLIDKLTNGSVIEINSTGTALYYQPGVLHGGEIQHDCSLERGIGYFLEMIMCFAPFCKTPILAKFMGNTNHELDPSYEALKFSSRSVLARFLGSDRDLRFQLIKRGVPPDGGGEIWFSCPIKSHISALQFTDPGKVKSIRGVAWTCRSSPMAAKRMIESARSVLLKFCSNTFIYDNTVGLSSCGKSPGFGLTLWAETDAGVSYCAEMASKPRESSGKINKINPSIPEDVGVEAAQLLLEEICRGGCVDSGNQFMAVLMMVLGPTDVTKLQTGPLTPFTCEFLRGIRDFFQVTFKIEPHETDSQKEGLQTGYEKILLTCVGVGFTNLNKVIL